ncbi:MAG: hypothetical protein ABI434_16495 [Burkholderiaceae bacterium]
MGEQLAGQKDIQPHSNDRCPAARSEIWLAGIDPLLKFQPAHVEGLLYPHKGDFHARRNHRLVSGILSGK